MLALKHAVDVRMLLRDTLNELLGRIIEMEAIVDSQTLFYELTENSHDAERHLQIEILALRTVIKRKR